jgi:anaerobic selenocysteine-containing dehydrogenase
VADAFEWDSYETYLGELLGDQWDTLIEEVYTASDELPEPAYETDAGAFTFPSGTFDAVAAEGDTSGFPLLLLPYDYMRLATGYIGDPPFMMKTVEDSVLKGNDMFVEVNPKTAKALGLKDGESATLETPKGKADVLVRMFEGVMPGIVAMPRGLGHTAFDAYLAAKGQNVNDLIGSVEDPASGLDAVWGIRAKLSQA